MSDTAPAPDPVSTGAVSDALANEILSLPDPTAPVDVEPVTATVTEPAPPSEPSPPTGDPGSTPDLSPLPPVEGVSATPDAEPDQSTPQEVAVDPTVDPTVETAPVETPPASPPEAAPSPSPVAEPAPPVVDGPVQQRTFHDTREIAAAEASGLPTPEGVPLQPAALLTLRDLDAAITAMEGWIVHFRQTLDKVMRL